LPHLIWVSFVYGTTPSGACTSWIEWTGVVRKCVRVAIKRDDEAIAHWIRYSVAADKKRRMNSRLNSFFSMKVAFRWFRPWAQLGTARMHAGHPHESHHRQRINAIGALVLSPRDRRIRLAHSTATTAISPVAADHRIPRCLLQKESGRSSFGWDNAPIHVAKRLPCFLAEHPRLHVYEFPRMRLNSSGGIMSGLRSIVRYEIPSAEYCRATTLIESARYAEFGAYLA